MVLFPLLGITWLFGLLVFATHDITIQYLFAFSNSLQVHLIISFTGQIQPLSVIILCLYIAFYTGVWTNRVLLPKKYALAHKRYSRFCGLANNILPPKL